MSPTPPPTRNHTNTVIKRPLVNKVTSPYNESRQSPKRLDAIKLPHCSSLNRRKRSTPKPRLDSLSRTSKIRIKRIVENTKVSQESTDVSSGSGLYNFSKIVSPQNCRYGAETSFDLHRGLNDTSPLILRIPEENYEKFNAIITPADESVKALATPDLDVDIE